MEDTNRVENARGQTPWPLSGKFPQTRNGQEGCTDHLARDHDGEYGTAPDLSTGRDVGTRVEHVGIVSMRHVT